ncbi:DUF5615 family PIN-like protein [Nocardia sp. NPDC052566]|uniref:DUF5615 family PIN-like protein n=1 Tax=Nocardia sp. NPDC052566 TaxID=3364330 RepID=UPI0037CBB8E3
MRFLVDALLPRRLATFLNSAGHDAVHTSELELGHLDDIVELFSTCSVVELGRDRLVGHTDRDPD